MTFLQEVAETLTQRHDRNLSNVAVVFQNRRAALYFKHHLAARSNGAARLPHTASILDFWCECTGFRPMEHAELLFAAFDSYRSAGGLDGLEEFLAWAGTALDDFDEIDHYRIDPSRFFQALCDWKRVEAWSPDGQVTSRQQKYLEHLKILQPWYDQLSEGMRGVRRGYDGWIARQGVSDLQALRSAFAYDRTYFVGFNVLTRCEEICMKFFSDHGWGEVIVDADEYYVHDVRHEAGSGLRGMARTMGWDQTIPGVGNHFRSMPKNITTLFVPGHHGQSSAVGSILAGLSEAERNQTAVVLADESLLMPVLHSIPSSVASVNVSMGFPCRLTLTADLVNLLLDLQENSQRWTPRAWYYKDIQRALDHPLWGRKNGRLCRQVRQQMTERNLSVIQVEEWRTLTQAEPDFGKWISLWEDGAQGMEALQGVIADWMPVCPSPIEREAACALYRAMALLRRYASGHALTIRVVREWMTRLIAEIRLPFIGEPLEGLQVLGILETRSLDFRNVILVSANEGVLPQSVRRDSSIPYEVRREWQLPTYELHDGIVAYNFYRLLQRAENIWMLADCKTGDLGDGEPSRFVQQIHHECGELSSIAVRREAVRLPMSARGPRRTDTVEKDHAILERLRTLFQGGISPSAWNTYRECSMRFYYRYILGLREEDEIDESMDARMLGEIVHGCLFTLYEEARGQTLDPGWLRQKKKSVPEVVLQEARKRFGEGDLQSGKNFLMSRVAQRWLEEFLAWDAERAQQHEVVVQGLEDTVTRSLEHETEPVLFKGRVDRVDLVDGQMVVTDYKTGAADLKSFDSMEKVLQDNYPLQLALYAWLTTQEDVPACGVYSMRHREWKPLLIDNKPLSIVHVRELEEQMRKWITEATDPRVPFRRTDEKNCQYCDFRLLCLR